MSFTLRSEIANWLENCEVLQRHDYEDVNDKIILSEGAVQKLLDGTTISNLLHKAGQIKNLDSSYSYLNRPNSSSFSAAAFRVYNWVNIADDLAKHDITLSADMRSLITAGDSCILNDLLEDMYNKIEVNSYNSSRLASTLAQYLESEHGSTSEIDTYKEHFPQSASIMEPTISEETTVETVTERVEVISADQKRFTKIIIDSMVEHLHCTNEQAVELFKNSENQSSLKTIILSEQGGQFEDLSMWLKVLHISLEKFPYHDKNFSFQFLNLITIGFQTDNADVLRWTCRVLSNFKINFLPDREVYGWFTSNTLQQVIRCVSLPNQDLNPLFSSIIIKYSPSNNLLNLIENNIPKFIPDVAKRLNFFSNIGCFLRNNFEDEFQLQEAIKVFLSIGLQCSELMKESEIQSSLQLLINIWCEYPEVVQKLETECEKIIQTLRRKCRQQSKSTKTCCILCMFRLLEVLITTRNQLAPQIYKGLVFLLIENRAEQPIRDLITANFTQIMTKLHSIPPQVLVEPLVREISLEGYSNLDLEFISMLSNHPRLPVKYALLFAHMLGKIAVNDPVFARLAMIPFLTLIARFNTKPLMQDYVEKYCKVAVSMFLKAVERVYTASGLENGMDTNKIRQELSLEILQKIAQLKIKVYAERMNGVIQITCEEYKRIYGNVHPILKNINEIIQEQVSDSADTMSIFENESNMENRTSVLAQEHEETNEREDSMYNARDELFPTESRSQSNFSRQISESEKRARKLLEDPSPEGPDATNEDNIQHLLDSAAKDQHELNELTMKNQKKIEELRRQQEELHHEEMLEMEKNQEKKLDRRSRDRQKQMEEEKYNSMREMQQSYAITSPPQKSSRRHRPAKLATNKRKPQKLETYEFKKKKKGREGKSEWPEEVKVIITSTNAKPLRRIFKVFKGKKPRPQRAQTFDELSKAKSCLIIADFYNIFDHLKVVPNMLSKTEISHISREIAEDGGRLITLSGFLVSIWLISNIAYPSEPNPIRKVEKLLEHLQMESKYSNLLNTMTWQTSKNKKKKPAAKEINIYKQQQNNNKRIIIKSLSPVVTSRRSPRHMSPSHSHISYGINRATREKEEKEVQEHAIRIKAEEKRRKRAIYVKKKLAKQKADFLRVKEKSEQEQRMRVIEEEEELKKKEYVHQKRQEKLKRQIQTHKQEMEQQYGFVPISGDKNYSSYWD